jgi:hypothetical protein
LEYVTYVLLHFPDNNKEKSNIKDIDTDFNLYKKVVDLWKREKEKEFILKTLENNNALYEKIKDITLESSRKK